MAAIQPEQAHIMTAQSPDQSLPDDAKSPLPAWAWWMAGGLFIAAMILRDILKSSGGLIPGEVELGRDFVNVWTGGHLVRSGMLDILYDPVAYAAYQRTLFGDIGPHNYSYPPVTFPLVALFAMLPYFAALALWLGGTGALFVRAARDWWPKGAGPVWLAVLTPAAILNIWTGHYGFLIGALFLFGWQNLDKRPWVAGIFFGLMLIKPHLAVLVPIALVARGKWKAMLSGAITVAALVGATTLWFGWQPWEEFLFRNSGLQASMIDAGLAFYGLMSCSTATALLQVTGNWPIAAAGQVIAAGGAIAAVWTAARKRVATRDLAFMAATATFLVLPYSFNYDLTVVMIGALAIWSRTDVPALDHRLALYGFLAPQLGMMLAAMYLPLMPVLLGGLLYAQYRVALRDAGVSDRGALAGEAVAHSA
jgi:hypothetical protein